jgi:hypothetical protein
MSVWRGETNDRVQGSAGVTSLPDAERDVGDVLQALAGLAAMLRRPPEDRFGLDPREPDADDIRRLLLSIAEDGGEAAARVLAYLRDQRRAGDGDAVAVPPRLGPWRDWVPPRGHLFGGPAGSRQPDEVRQPRRSDPGE